MLKAVYAGAATREYGSKARLGTAGNNDVGGAFAGLGVSARNLALLAIGFGCMVGYSRMLTLGFVGYLSNGVFESTDLWYGLRSGATLAMFAVLALAGWFRWFKVGTKTLMLASVGAIASAIVFAVDSSGAFGWVVALVGGASAAMLMYVWLLLLSKQSVKVIVVSTLAGLAVSGAIIMGVPRIDWALALLVAVGSAFMVGASAILLDHDLACCAPDGPLDKNSAVRVPWLTLVMFLMCSFVGTAIYGIAQHLTWLYDWQPNYIAFGVGACSGIAATLALALRRRAWVHLVWVPLFAVLALALACSCFAIRDFIRVGVGFMLATVFCAHFLHWPVFSSLFSAMRIPRSFLAGVVLFFANGSLAAMLGDAVGGALPHSMQNLGGVAGIAAIALCVVFFSTLAAYRALLGQGDIPGITETGAEQLSKSAGMGDGGEGALKLEAGEEGPELGPDKPEASAAPADPLAFLQKRIDDLSVEYGLTPRESEVGFLTVQGFSCGYIAEKLVVSESTVRFHQKNLYRKLDVHSRNELIEFVQ